MTPKVKPLEWVKLPEAEHHGLTTYDCGFYRIDWKSWKTHDTPTLWRNDPDEFVGVHENLELAQAAAQADHDASIIAAIDPAWLARIAALEARVKATDAMNERLSRRIYMQRAELRWLSEWLTERRSYHHWKKIAMLINQRSGFVHPVPVDARRDSWRLIWKAVTDRRAAYRAALDRAEADAVARVEAMQSEAAHVGDQFPAVKWDDGHREYLPVDKTCGDEIRALKESDWFAITTHGKDE